MTDNQPPILADGLFDGGLAADVAPKELRSAVNLLNAAGRPGSEAELATMAARVRQFSAEINAAAKAAGRGPVPTVPSDMTAQLQRVAPEALLLNDISFTTETLTSSPLFATRITRKALTIVAITLLAAGTAAAAAGGVLPIFQDETSAPVIHQNHDTDADVDTDGSLPSGAGGATSVDDSMPGDFLPIVTVAEAIDPADLVAKCAQWSTASAADAVDASFVELQAAAAAVELTIDEYCTTLVTPTVASDDAPTAAEPADDSPTLVNPTDDPPTVTLPAVDPPTADPPAVEPPAAATPPVDDGADGGDGNHGHHGNGGHGNGNDHHGDDDHGNGNNGNHGNGNNGNHGNGNNGNHGH